MGSHMRHDSLPHQVDTAYCNRYYRVDHFAPVTFTTTDSTKSFTGNHCYRYFIKSPLYIHYIHTVLYFTPAYPYYQDRFLTNKHQQFLATFTNKHYTFYYSQQVVASFPHVVVSSIYKRTTVQVPF